MADLIYEQLRERGEFIKGPFASLMHNSGLALERYAKLNPGVESDPIFHMALEKSGLIKDAPSPSEQFSLGIPDKAGKLSDVEIFQLPKMLFYSTWVAGPVIRAMKQFNIEPALREQLETHMHLILGYASHLGNFQNTPVASVIRAISDVELITMEPGLQCVLNT